MKSKDYLLFTTVLNVIIVCQCSVRPNIVLIVTDDQDVFLNGMRPMRNVNKLIGLNGATFTNSFTSSPICCPSRASILTGQYAHNHATTNNSQTGGCYGEFWRENREPWALPVILERNGYTTFFAGKYLNGYNGETVPPGWSDWNGLIGNSKYYNYSLNENGVVRNYANEYLTDLIKTKAVKFITDTPKGRPFFAMISPPAPHAPFTPAPRHSGVFANVTALKTPNFNRASGRLDKHWLLQMKPRTLSKKVLNTLDEFYRNRWESLLAVDELVLDVVQSLKDNHNFLENTYIVFTSDNGYHIGQFAQAFDKRQPYETDIRVPLLVAGPNIAPKRVIRESALLIDLLPTIMEWCGIHDASRFPFQPHGSDGCDVVAVERGTEDCGVLDNFFLTMDGKSLADVLMGKVDMKYERKFLIEYWGEGNERTFNPDCPWKRKDWLAECTLNADCHCQDAWNNTFACVRHIAYDLDKIFCEFDDIGNFIEAYDLKVDPFQMENIGYTMLPSEHAFYSLDIAALRYCVGPSCIRN